jgi:hypothetical protein
MIYTSQEVQEQIDRLDYQQLLGVISYALARLTPMVPLTLDLEDSLDRGNHPMSESPWLETFRERVGSVQDNVDQTILNTPGWRVVRVDTV